MNTTLTLSLGTHEKTDGTYPVVIRISHFQKGADVPTGVSLKAEDWDEKKRKVKGTYKGTQSVTRLNTYLEKKKSEASDKVKKLDEKGRLTGMTAKEIKKHLEGKSGTDSFFEFADELIAGMKKAKKIGNARAYQSAVAALKNFASNKDLTFREINLDFLNAFEEAHYAKDNTVNGLSVYLRTVRAIYNKAILKGLVDEDMYPFKKYKIKGKRSGKKAMPHEAIKTVEAIAEPAKRRHIWVRHYFLLMYFLRGMSFVDACHLKVKYINNGRIKYDRRKSGSSIDMEIPAQAQAIIDHYIEGKSPDDYLLPVITADTAEKQYNQVLDKRKKFNRYLKEFAPDYGIPANVTSSIIRNSYATRANNLGVPLSVISEMLGHSDLRTTQIYLDSLPKETTDSYHRKIVE